MLTSGSSIAAIVTRKKAPTSLRFGENLPRQDGMRIPSFKDFFNCEFWHDWEYKIGNLGVVFGLRTSELNLCKQHAGTPVCRERVRIVA
jgi:hypothetical protein